VNGDRVAAEPGKGHAAKAAEWRGKLIEVGTEAQRHEGTEEGDKAREGNDDSSKP